MRPPGVMVSSTFYDLKQHREVLRRFLQDELGYRPLLSEHPSFPINPDMASIPNCRERVQRDTDVLVLVVGRRYGSLDDHSAKSVTNLEYLTAREKGIPIYAFVERGILNLLPVWRRNKAIDLSAEVDSTQLFEFVESIRGSGGIWTQEFDHVQDIVEALRIQFAYLQTDNLMLRARLKGLGRARWMDGLSGETLRIALEQPMSWEYRLFASAFSDTLAAHHKLRRRHELGVGLGLGEDVTDPATWATARFNEAGRIAVALGQLVNEELPLAFGQQGVPGDRERILFIADTLGDLYRDALLWAARVRTANVRDEFRPALVPLGRMLDELIGPVERLASDLSEQVKTALASGTPGVNQVLEFTLVLGIPPEAIAEFQAAIAAATNHPQPTFGSHIRATDPG